MSSRLSQCLSLSLLFCLGGLAASSQEPLTLRQAINQALGQNPEAAIARAGNQDAKAAAALARAALLPQLGFTEDISRGNDPVYVFGSKLRQGQFTLADFAVNALNRPQLVGNFSTKLSGSWMAFDSFKTQKEIRRADLFKASTASSANAVDQQIVFRVVGAYQSVLYAQREIDVAQHEQETAAALLASVDDHVKAGLAVESDRMSALVNVAARKQELARYSEGEIRTFAFDVRNLFLTERTKHLAICTRCQHRLEFWSGLVEKFDRAVPQHGDRADA